MNGLPENLSSYKVTLTRLEKSDIETVRRWRNHHEVSRWMFSQDKITSEQQEKWFASVNDSKDKAYFLIRYQGAAEGVASVSSDDGGRLMDAQILEAAIYFAPESRCKGNLMAFAPALTLNDACFSYMNCKILKARVKVENESAIRFNKAMGYEITETTDAVITMEMNQQQYEAASQNIKNLLNR